MKGLFLSLIFFAAVIFGIKSCNESEWYQADLRAQREKEIAEQTPHVIREADGCKVYAFLADGRYHYFTKCPESKTSTESSWQKCHRNGKTQSCETLVETIETAR